MKRIALIGDYSESVVAHRAIPMALKLAVGALNADVSWEWVHSRTLSNPAAQLETLFQPERAALRDQLPPLVKAFVAAIA